MTGSAFALPVDSSARVGQNNAASKSGTQSTIPTDVQNDIHAIARALEAANFHPDAAAEEQRAKDNLKAQQETSQWAKTMLYIAGAETVVTLIGVILVGFTLNHTRRAADAAEKALTDTRQAAEAAQKSAEAAIGSERAWVLLFIDKDNLEEAVLQRIDPKSWAAQINDKPIIPEVACHIENMGKTPAFIREFSARLICAGATPPAPDYTPSAPWWPEETILAAGVRFPFKDPDGALDYRTTTVQGFGTEAAKSFDTKDGGDPAPGKFWFYGRIVYADVWGTVHTTTFCFANEVWSSWFIPPECIQLNQRT